MDEETSVTPTQVLITRMKTLREQQGLSARQLTEKMNAEAGASWHGGVVAKLENGRRQSVTVEELLGLAYVLNCPPAALLAPIGEDVAIELAPDVTTKPYELYGWIVGRSRAAVAGRARPDTAADLQQWSQSTRPLVLYGQLSDAGTRLHECDLEVTRAEKIGDEQRLRDARAAYADALSPWAEAVAGMQQLGMALPAVPPRWLDDARDMGLLQGDQGGDDGR